MLAVRNGLFDSLVVIDDFLHQRFRALVEVADD